MKALVLGLGNILLSDEGIGVRVVEALERLYTFPPGVELADGGTSAMDMLDTLLSCENLIVVDAVRTGAPPGTLVRLAGDDVPAFFRTKISPHQVGLCDVLATLKLLDWEIQTITVIGCVPACLDTSLELSPTLLPRIGPMTDMVIEELQRLGLTATARAAM